MAEAESQTELERGSGPRSLQERVPVPSARVLLVVAVFGAAALAIVVAGLTIPIPDTSVVTDPRELFTTTGAALTGPFGGIVIGLLAGIREPDGIAAASLLAHISGGLWMGIAYKKLVYERTRMPVTIPAWASIILVYYYGVVVPGFVVGLKLFHEGAYNDSFGESASLISAYFDLGDGALPEALLTTLVTTLAYMALPRRHRRPLW